MEYSQEAQHFYDNTSNQFSTAMNRQFGQYYPLVTFSSILSVLIIFASLPPIPLFIDITNNDDSSGSSSNSTYTPTMSPTYDNSTGFGNNTKSPSGSQNYFPVTRVSTDSSSDVFLYVVLVMAFLYSFVVIMRMFHALRQRQRLVGMVNNMSANTGQIRQLMQSLTRPGRAAAGLSAGNLRSRLRLAMMNRDFTGDDFDLLRQLDDMDSQGHFGPGPGMEQGDINRLPLHTITESDLKSSTADADSQGSGARTNGNKSCSVCLAPYEVGDSVRTMTCLHQFHRDCIDTWLHTHSTCPICKFAAVVD